jgi:hypothetical protein
LTRRVGRQIASVLGVGVNGANSQADCSFLRRVRTVSRNHVYFVQHRRNSGVRQIDCTTRADAANDEVDDPYSTGGIDINKCNESRSDDTYCRASNYERCLYPLVPLV